MTFDEFEAEASRVWEEIPDTYRSGVDGLVIEKKSQAHPSMEDIYTLGECLTESYPSDWGGPDTTRSVLVLYFGSFRRLAELDPDFDWRYEIWETVTHELRHHLESLAAEDALEDVDFAMDENFKRLRGEPFDPFFYRAGERVAAGIFQAERDLFMEMEHDGEPGDVVAFEWEGRIAEAPVPPDPGDVTFIQIVSLLDHGEERLDPEMELCLVLVRRRGVLAGLTRWLRRESPAVVQVEATARVVETDTP
jgi:hypothetical protein